MKIEKDKNDGMTYVYFGKDNNSLAHLVSQWSQFSGDWSWVDFDLIRISFMKDNILPGWELEAIFLGVGFRIRYNKNEEFYET